MKQVAMQEQLTLPATYETSITSETMRRIEELKSTIDVHDRGKVIAYGCEEQASIGKFSDSILKGVGSNEIGEAGELLTQVIGRINGYNTEANRKEGGFLSFFKKQKSKLQTLQAKYQSLAENMDVVIRDLQKKDFSLGQVSNNFEIMYQENCKLYEFLTMVIYAGEKVLQDEQSKLQDLKQKAQISTDPMESQRVSDFESDILRFERRLYDLKLSRTIAIQQAPQIRLIQKGADEVSESIKKAIVTAIPLWKTQMAMALGMQAVREGLEAVGRVRETTNAIILTNSQMNKQLTLEIAQATEKGVVDIETINKVNQDLIDTLASSYEIAQKAIQRRDEGAKKLQENEAELKEAIVQYTNLY